MKTLLLAAALLAVPMFASEIDDLNHQAEHWKQQLYMSEWTVNVHAVPLEVLFFLCQAHCLAASSWDVESRSGNVFILQRRAYSKDLREHLNIKDVKADQRNSIVHEFLHNVIQNMQTEKAIAVISYNLSAPGKPMGQFISIPQSLQEGQPAPPPTEITTMPPQLDLTAPAPPPDPDH